MTQADIDEERLNIEVGFAPLKPAEFVVIRIGRRLGAVATEIVGESTGEPGLELRLPHAWVDPVTVVVMVEHEDGWRAWSSVEDLATSGPAEADFVVEVDEEGNGSVRFGDGEHGAIPANGTRVQASYRYGAGEEATSGRDTWIIVGESLAPLPRRSAERDGEGSNFTGGGGACRGMGPCAVEMDQDRSRRLRSRPGCWWSCGTRFGEDLTLHPLLVGLAIAFVLWVAAIVALVAMGRIAVARELVGLIPNMLLLFKDLVRDERVPRSAKLWLGFAAVWLASPIDLIPEFIPVLGPLDDAVVAAVVLRHLVRKAGSEVVYERWRGEPSTISRVLRLFGASDPLSREGEG